MTFRNTERTPAAGQLVEVIQDLGGLFRDVGVRLLVQGSNDGLLCLNVNSDKYTCNGFTVHAELCNLVRDEHGNWMPGYGGWSSVEDRLPDIEDQECFVAGFPPWSPDVQTVWRATWSDGDFRCDCIDYDHGTLQYVTEWRDDSLPPAPIERIED